jgi:dipeptide/tripeptide permease
MDERQNQAGHTDRMTKQLSSNNKTKLKIIIVLSYFIILFYAAGKQFSGITKVLFSQYCRHNTVACHRCSVSS